MYRALSTQEEHAVRRLINATADDLGISRPLDADGWHRVKDYLRSQPADVVPRSWGADEEAYRWIRGAACAHLVIDPRPTWNYTTTKGLGAVRERVLSYLAVPNTRFGFIVDSLVHAAMVIAIAAGVGAIFSLLTACFGLEYGPSAFALGAMVGYFLLGIVVSTNTMFGVWGMVMFALGAYELASDPWTVAEWGRTAITAGGTVFGALIVVAWLT